ncbi:hypothetical protein H0E87_011323, partial [Populus deltoides]
MRLLAKIPGSSTTGKLIDVAASTQIESSKGMFTLKFDQNSLISTSLRPKFTASFPSESTPSLEKYMIGSWLYNIGVISIDSILGVLDEHVDVVELQLW